MTLQQLAAEIEKLRAQKYDFVAPARALGLDVEGKFGLLQDEGFTNLMKNQLLALGIAPAQTETNFSMSPNFRKQLAEKLAIPGEYFERMLGQATPLLQENVNWWLHNDKDVHDKRYLVRTYNTSEQATARAFLSDSYKPMDYDDVLYTVLDTVREANVEVEVKDCQLTESRMYVRVVSPNIGLDINELKRTGIIPDLGQGHRFLKDEEGGWMITGFIFGTSEIGHGSYFISPLVHKLACTNYYIMKEAELRRIHLGTKLDAGFIKWSDFTRNKVKELLVAQTRDAIRTFLSPEFLGQMGQRLLKASEYEFKHPTDAVELVCYNVGIRPSDRKAILDYFVKNKENNLLGVADAITYHAHMQPDEDYRYDLERAGARVLELNGATFDHATN